MVEDALKVQVHKKTGERVTSDETQLPSDDIAYLEESDEELDVRNSASSSSTVAAHPAPRSIDQIIRRIILDCMDERHRSTSHHLNPFDQVQEDDFIVTMRNTANTAAIYPVVEDISNTANAAAIYPVVEDMGSNSVDDGCTEPNIDAVLTGIIDECVTSTEPKSFLDPLDPDEKSDTTLMTKRHIKWIPHCFICEENLIEVLFLPCGHFNTCIECGPRLRRCPVCRGRITGAQRVFMP